MHAISPHRCCDYSGPRFAYTSEPREMPLRCDQPTCFALAEHRCAATGDPLCDEHAFRCEEAECFERDLHYRLADTVLVDGMRFCRRHAMRSPVSENEEEE